MEKSLFKSFHVELYSNNAEVQVLIILSHHFSLSRINVSNQGLKEQIIYTRCSYIAIFSCDIPYFIHFGLESNSNEYNF